jgi:diguanylate cyclase
MSLSHKKYLFYYAAGFIIFISVFVITEFIIHLLHDNQLHQQRSKILDKSAAMRARIEGEINSTLHLTRGLIAYVATHPEFSDLEFSLLSSEIIINARSIRNIGLAKKNIVSHVYPLAGNEAALGLDYKKNSQQWPAVKKAIDSKMTVVAGPVELVQGGKAFIARTPIFTRSGISGNLETHKPYYWGMAAIVINMSELFKKAGFNILTQEVKYALRGKDGMGAEGEMILGDKSLFNLNPVLTLVDFPGGNWQIAAMPANGWGVDIGVLWIFRISGWILALLLGVLIRALLITREINKNLALYDHLTKLPNRRLFEDRLKQLRNRIKRNNSSFGFFYIDLNKFKQINDKYGHQAGDELLVETSKRILASIRNIDTASRIGGDEFVVMVETISQKSDMQRIHQQLKKNLKANVFVDGQSVILDASIGTAVYPDDGTNIDELLKTADNNMYLDKKLEKAKVINLPQ